MKPPFKRALKPLRELIRMNDTANRAWLQLVYRLRSERAKLGDNLGGLAERMQHDVSAVKHVGGDIGTTDAWITWHYEGTPAAGFEIELHGETPRRYQTHGTRFHFTDLEPHTVYRGTVRALDAASFEHEFSFWTRPRGVTGYAMPLSAMAGEEVDVFISSEVPAVTVTLRPLLHTDCPIGEWVVAAPYQYAPYRASSDGCGWKRTLTMKVPDTAPSGVYLIHLQSPDDASEFVVPLIVRPARVPDIAVVCSTNTWSAYNDWGGISLYENRISLPEPLFVTEARPNYMAEPFGQGTFHLLEGEMHIYRHLEKNGFEAGFYSDHDMAAGALRGCKTIVLCTHNEYWGEDKVAELDALQAAGVNVLCLSGNTLYRKIIREKSKHAFSRHGYFSEEETCSRLGTIYTALGRETGAPYQVTRPDHWIFEGCQVTSQTQFGRHRVEGLSASGVETDKRMPSSPPGIEMVAKGTNPDQGGAEWVVFRHPAGGLVLNAGSITMSLNMADPIIDRMVVNALVKMGHRPVVAK